MTDGAIVTRRRDFQVIGVVSLGHFFSHLYQVALPFLFPLIHVSEGISYTRLGVLVTVFYAVSGFSQTPAGILVDRFGARPVLVAGFGLLIGATSLYGFAPNYGALVALAAVAGLGNSVFHPCQFSVLSATVSEPRMGRAYSFHSFGGFLGYAAAPTIMGLIAPGLGWRTSIIIVGLVGFAALAVVAMFSHVFRDSSHIRAELGLKDVPAAPLLSLLGPAILLSFMFFMFAAGGQSGLQSSGPAALIGAFGTSYTQAAFAFSCFLIAAPTGILTGGVLVDWKPTVAGVTPNEVGITMGAFSIAAAMILLISLTSLTPIWISALLAVAGFFYGLASPSRDLLTRAVVPPGSSGKVFGLVYSGLDAGSATTPVIFGWLIDNDLPRVVFMMAAGLIVAATICILSTRRFVPARKAPSSKQT